MFYLITKFSNYKLIKGILSFCCEKEEKKKKRLIKVVDVIIFFKCLNEITCTWKKHTFYLSSTFYVWSDCFGSSASKGVCAVNCIYVDCLIQKWRLKLPAPQLLLWFLSVLLNEWLVIFHMIWSNAGIAQTIEQTKKTNNYNITAEHMRQTIIRSLHRFVVQSR